MWTRTNQAWQPRPLMSGKRLIGNRLPLNDPQACDEAVVLKRRVACFLMTAGVLVLLFGRVLFELSSFSAESELYSYILLVPPICFYLFWTGKSGLCKTATPGLGSVVCFVAGIAIAMAVLWATTNSATPFVQQNYLAGATLSFLLSLASLIALFFGLAAVRIFAFPLGFLFFLIPFPVGFEALVNTVLQIGSARVALELFHLANTPVHYHSLVFQLPGISIEVAPECSGIRSSLILFFTSLLASHFFLSTFWKKAVIVLFVMPLAIFRNAVRIFTIGELCVHIRPEMIDSYIHHHGGPIFFALSLIPFSLLLLLLRRSDRSPDKTKSTIKLE